MELRPISDAYADGKPLPSIHDQISKKQTKHVDLMSKLSSPDRLQAILKSNKKVPPVKDQGILTAIGKTENNVASNDPNTPLYGDPETQKVELLREGYFRAKSRADEYLLLVAAEKETLSARGWVPGNGDSAATDLYTFKSRSAEKKQQYHQANRLYYGLSTLLYASIGAMKANELDVYVRRKALLLPGSIFDINEWEQFLKLAKECRSKEWRDEDNAATALKVSTKAEESNKANLKSSLKSCMECLRSLRLDSEGMTDEVQDSTKEFGRYMIGAKKKIEEAMLKQGKTLVETNRLYQAALASLEVEKDKNRKLMIDVDEKVRLDILMYQDDFEDKMRIQRDGYEAELREKESERKRLLKENEDFADQNEKSNVRQQILETRLALLETSHAENLLKIKKQESTSSDRASHPASKVSGINGEKKSSDVIPDESKPPRHFTEEEKENFKRVKERVAELEGELEVARERQVMVMNTKWSVPDTYGQENAAVVVNKDVLVRLEDVFEKKESESWEESNKMRDLALQKLREEEEKEREEVEKLFLELKRQEKEEALQKEREEAARIEYELRMKEEESRIEKERLREELARKTAVLELRKKEIEKEEQEIAELQRLEQEAANEKNSKIEALRLAKLHEVEEVARLAEKKKQEEEDIAARIKQEEEEEERERIEDEKRIADWKILEAKRNEEEIIGEVVKAKELVRRQSMVISDEVELMTTLIPPETAVKGPDSNDENEDEVWTDFMAIEEWDGDNPPMIVEGGPALDTLISGRVPCPAKAGRAKKKAVENKKEGWANDLEASETPPEKDPVESAVAPAQLVESKEENILIESKAEARADPEAASSGDQAEEDSSELATEESAIVKEKEKGVDAPTQSTKEKEKDVDAPAQSMKEKDVDAPTQSMKEKEKDVDAPAQLMKERDVDAPAQSMKEKDVDASAQSMKEKEKVSPPAALELTIPVIKEADVPTSEKMLFESSAPSSAIGKKEKKHAEDEVVESRPSVLDMPLDVGAFEQYQYPSNANDSQRQCKNDEKMADQETEGLKQRRPSMLRNLLETFSPGKQSSKDRFERDLQRRKSEKEEEDAETNLKESRKEERRPSRSGKDKPLTKEQKAAKAIERQKKKEENAKLNEERERVYREVGYRILAVQNDGPAFRGKLEASVDLIVAVRGHRLRVLDSTLIDAIKGSEDKLLPLTVYNCNTQTERDIELLPTRKWKGEGLLGATIRFEGYHEEGDDDAPR